ncbi:hypothetical protein ACJX0J_029604, partial [Zea mays]
RLVQRAAAMPIYTEGLYDQRILLQTFHISNTYLASNRNIGWSNSDQALLRGVVYDNMHFLVLIQNILHGDLLDINKDVGAYCQKDRGYEAITH